MARKLRLAVFAAQIAYSFIGLYKPRVQTRGFNLTKFYRVFGSFENARAEIYLFFVIGAVGDGADFGSFWNVFKIFRKFFAV